VKLGFASGFKRLFGGGERDSKEPAVIGEQKGEIHLHIDACDAESFVEQLKKPGSALNAIKKTAIEMHRVSLSDRASELLAGDVATEHDMRDIINGMVDAAGSKTRVAAKLGVSIAYLTDVMMGRRPLGGKLAGSLGGWEKIVVYRKR